MPHLPVPLHQSDEGYKLHAVLVQKWMLNDSKGFLNKDVQREALAFLDQLRKFMLMQKLTLSTSMLQWLHLENSSSQTSLLLV
jgi:hypothetical protein